jgi:hypothetical protein
MKDETIIKIAEDTAKTLAGMQFFEPCGQLMPTYNALIKAAKGNHPDEPFLQALPESNEMVEDGVNQLKILFSQLRIALDSLRTNNDSAKES